MRRLAIVAAAFALLATGCGDEEGGGSGASAAIPPDPVLYVEADISGEGDQHDKLDALLAELGEVPLLGAPLDPKAIITQAFEDLGAESGVDISYEEDFEPWLGDSVALGFSSLADPDPRFVLSVDVEDEEIAQDAITRISAEDAATETDEEYDGVAYQVSGDGDYAVGVFDDKFVLATAEEFEDAVDASRGDSLATSEEADDALAALGEERLAALYLDTGAALDLAVAEGDLEAAEADIARSTAPEVFDRPLAAALIAGERTLALDVAVGHADDAPELSSTDRLEEAPGDAFAAVGLADLGAQIEAILNRIEPVAAAAGELLDREAIAAAFEAETGAPLDEVLASAGDAVAYGRGELPDAFVAGLDVSLLGGGDAPAQLLDGLERLAAADDDTIVGPPLGGAETGFSAEPKPRVAAGSTVRFVNAELGDELSLAAASDRQAAERPAAGTLAGSDRFQAAKAALSDDYEMLAFADLAPILDAVIGGGSLLDLATGAGSPEQAVLGFLADKLGFAAAGVRYEGDSSIQRLVVGLD